VHCHRNPTGAILRWYAYGLGPNDVLSQMNVAAATRATFIPDIQGSVIASIDSTSGTMSKIGYLPYGKSAVGSTPFGFTGQRIDPESSGLYYYRARHYSPAWGRFLQPDPIGYAGGSNLYAYVGNDPINYSDPTGMLTFFTGGAGNNGAYIPSMVTALQNAGIRNVQATSVTSGFFIDALTIQGFNSNLGPSFYSANAQRVSVPAGEQLNLVGYSWGAAMSAQAALSVAASGQRVDNVVLIGAPITQDLLDALRTSPNIGAVHTINLQAQGDPIRAGMSNPELLSSLPRLGIQYYSGEASGHFYYAGEGSTGDQRRQDLANGIRASGLK
jgi:RHS repeat-associated protein